MSRILTFLFYVDGLENKIWRIAEFDDEKCIASLAYFALATFNSLACRYYKIEDEDCRYDSMVPPIILDGTPFKDGTKLKLSSLNLYEDKELTMQYDLDHPIYIKIRYLGQKNESDLKTFYPKLISGKGKGIIENVDSSKLKEIIKDIDSRGYSIHKYSTQYDNEGIYDYREYDANIDQSFIKDLYLMIKASYERFILKKNN